MTNDSTLRPDVLVIGLGAMGSATTHQLAKRGAEVIVVRHVSIYPATHAANFGHSQFGGEFVCGSDGISRSFHNQFLMAG
jgi:UDP-N-acetylmuramoylalanine-D-glutamate ligase